LFIVFLFIVFLFIVFLFIKEARPCHPERRARSARSEGPEKAGPSLARVCALAQDDSVVRLVGKEMGKFHAG
jgi:hypothetical protein